MRLLAVGPLGMSHEEFWRSTPGEIIERIEGMQWREELEQRASARLVARIINSCHSFARSPKMTIDKLVGRAFYTRRYSYKGSGRILEPGSLAFQDFLEAFPESVRREYADHR